MKKSGISLLSVIASAFLAVSCDAILPEEPEDKDSTSLTTSTLGLRINTGTAAKSSISPDEDAVNHLYVMAYRKEDGRLMAAQSGKTAEDIEIELTAGEYNIYVTANMEGFQAPSEEKDLISFSHTIRSIPDMGEALPMCWHGPAKMEAGKKTTVLANLSRLVSKVGLSIDMGVLEGLKITSVRLRQGAGCIRPFMDGGSRILSEDEAMDGDHASEEDLRSLMAGETMIFYVAENCQGKLIEGNTDPWNKIPDSIDEKAGLCTFIEMTGEWEDTALYAGTVTYRFYLGGDAVTDFNVRGNSVYNLTLFLQEESLERMSWKIDTSDMVAVPWEASTSFHNNFHSHDDFYVTENILVEFSLDKRGQKYWEKRNYDFSLVGKDSQGRRIIRFNDPQDLGEGRFKAMGTCMMAGDYDVLMINNETGEIEYILESGTVHVPEIVASYDDVFTDEPVDGFDTASEFTINGGYRDICLYLTDRDGYNLNQGHFYGCDLSLCDWETGIPNSAFGHDLYDGAGIEVFYGECEDDSYAVRYRIRFDNEGKNKQWNRMLTESLGNGVAEFSYKEVFSGAEGSHPLGLYCDPIHVSFRQMPYNQAPFTNCEFMYLIDNPSNLPILIRGLKLNTMRTDVTLDDDLMPILSGQVEGMTETKPLLITKMPYTFCSLESDASYHFTYNKMTAYAADDSGIEEFDVPDQTAMFHTFDVRLAYNTTGWFPEINGDYSMDTIIYGNGYGAYMNCGVIFHTYSNKREIYSSHNGEIVDFRNYGSILGKDAVTKFNVMPEVTFSINEDNELIATSNMKTGLSISISGILRGHTRCVSVDESTYAIWGHYFDSGHRFKVDHTVQVDWNGNAVDGGAIADSFEKIREQEYYSKLNADTIEDFRIDDGKSTTLREHLKPYALELEITVTTSEGGPVVLKGLSGSAVYEFILGKRVTWRLGSSRVVNIIPSAFASFDSYVAGKPGYTFIEETVKLTPKVKFNTQNLYYMYP